MPGLYTEPAVARGADPGPACAQYGIINDQGQTGALSYKWQFHCPNDQNLIAVIGREPGTADPPSPPLEDRHGIPDLGPCIRCNLQIEGSGAAPDDVTIDAGRVESGDGAPIGSAKDVGIRADRADGIVIRNLKVRHAAEHDIYVLESDGYLLDRFKTFYGGEYGVLTFVEDHGRDAELRGRRQRRLGPLPGRRRRHRPPARHEHLPGVPLQPGDPLLRLAPQHQRLLRHGRQRHPHPRQQLLRQRARLHDRRLHGARAPRLPAGLGPRSRTTTSTPTTSTRTCAGSDVDAERCPVPVGTGMWIAGGNDNVVRNNHFYDNWRRGVMLFAVPDQVVCGPAGIDPTLLAGCNPTAVPPSTSYRNEFYGNVMGRAPGARRGAAERHRRRHDGPHGLLVGPVPRDDRQLLARQHRAGRDAAQRDEHAAGAAAAVQLRQHEHRHRRARSRSPSSSTAWPTSSSTRPTCPWFTTPSKP